MHGRFSWCYGSFVVHTHTDCDGFLPQIWAGAIARTNYAHYEKCPRKNSAEGAAAGTGDETSARELRRGWEMGLLCHRKYREAARPRNKGIFQLLSGNHRCSAASRSCSYEYGRGSENGRREEGEHEGKDEGETTGRTGPNEKERAGEEETPFRIPRASLLISPHFYCTCRR